MCGIKCEGVLCEVYVWSVRDVWCGHVSWWVVERLGWCRACSHVT